MIKAIIIDDEKMARSLLENMLKEFCTDVVVLDTCKDLPTGVKSIRKLNPDLVFLDIEMPGHSGLELLDFFNDDEVNFSLIFTTAYNHYAIDAFKLSAVDYLLKPIDSRELENAVERFKKMQPKQNYQALKTNLQNNSQSKKITIHTTGVVKFVDLNDILYLKADGSYTHIIIKNNDIIMASKVLKSFEDTLSNQPEFYRCHKSYIVNINYLKEFVRSDGGYLKMENGHQVSISNEKLDGLFQLINSRKN